LFDEIYVEKWRKTKMGKMTETKAKILELLWVNESPVYYKRVAEELGLKPRAANMHLMGLLKGGYVIKSKGNEYSLTSSGKEAIGLPKTDEKLAKKVLGKTSKEKAFHFYKGISQPTGILADSLDDFCEKLKMLDVKIVEFHTERGDFEAWVSSLGDVELAKRLKVIRGTKLTGEALRKKIHGTIKSRCNELLSMK
jgi:DNA-binding MarR family transcriptional regulator